jgi:exodeoxyribonuclease VII small subunit
MPRQADDYKTMMQELQELLADMQDAELDVDAALERYERGQELIAKLNIYLKTAENKIIQRTSPKNGKAA